MGCGLNRWDSSGRISIAPPPSLESSPKNPLLAAAADLSEPTSRPSLPDQDPHPWAALAKLASDYQELGMAQHDAAERDASVSREGVKNGAAEAAMAPAGVVEQGQAPVGGDQNAHSDIVEVGTSLVCYREGLGSIN